MLLPAQQLYTECFQNEQKLSISARGSIIVQENYLVTRKLDVSFFHFSLQLQLIALVLTLISESLSINQNCAGKLEKSAISPICTSFHKFECIFKRWLKQFSFLMFFLFSTVK